VVSDVNISGLRQASEQAGQQITLSEDQMAVCFCL